MAVPPRKADGAADAPRFGDYRLLRKIASGGSSEVWLADGGDCEPGAPVALKRLLPSVADDPVFVATLREEARALAAIDPPHPNLPRLHASGVVEARQFLAMEHVDGRDLRAILGRMRERGDVEFPLEHAVVIALGLAAGLGHVHARGMVHRDVSPGNVLVSFAGEVKLVDFGFALAEDRPGTLRGTAGYTSPEQVRGEPLDGASDVFSVGVLLFELTTGKRLFRGASELETAVMIRERDAVRPSTIRPSYPAALEAIVMRALARSRADRYPSARSLEADLAAFAAGNGHSASASGSGRALARFMAILGR